MSTKTALITGATGGIGRELAREFARHGYDLVLSSTSRERLETLAADLEARYQIHATVAVADLTRPESPEALYRFTRSRDIRVDVLVNNAGFGLGGRFHENDPKVQLDMIKVNTEALTALCRLYLPGMVARDAGGILNLCSLGSFVPGPENSVYCATKAYALSLTEALAQELRDTGVAVTAVCPGSVETNFARRAGMETTLLFNWFVMEPRQVARTAYSAFARGKRVEVVGLPAKLMVQATRFVPRRMAALFSGLAQEPGRAEDEGNVVEFPSR